VKFEDQSAVTTRPVIDVSDLARDEELFAVASRIRDRRHTWARDQEMDGDTAIGMAP